MRVISMRSFLAIAVAIAVGCGASSVTAATILAGWTFETSLPTNAGPYVPEGGLFAATSQGSAGTGGTISNPVGNGSAESLSSTAWDAGDYYQFKTSSLGYENLTLSFDATSSNTGPRNFKVQASTDGSLFTDIGFSYFVLANAAPNAVWTSGTYLPEYNVGTSLPISLSNLADIYIRLVQVGTVSANGGTVTGAGTSRVDNVIVMGDEIPDVVIPEPATLALLSLAGMATISLARRRA
jgi:hypothetical protein